MSVVIVNMPTATPGCQCATCKQIREDNDPYKAWDDGRYPKGLKARG